MYIFTQKGMEELRNIVLEMRRDMKQLGDTKGKAAAGQDGWHSEAFKLASQQELVASKRLSELQEIMRSAKIVKPIEQSEKVMIGSGVAIQYQNGMVEKFIVDGFRLASIPHTVSVGSPMAKALIGAKVGEIKRVELPDEQTIKIRIKEIVPPSVAEEFVNNQ